MYIFVAKLPYERKIITCTDSVKLINCLCFLGKAFPRNTAQKNICRYCCLLLCIVNGFDVFPVAHSRLHVTQGKYHTKYTSTLYATLWIETWWKESHLVLEGVFYLGNVLTSAMLPYKFWRSPFKENCKVITWRVSSNGVDTF